MNLYRVMTDGRANSDSARIAAGTFGLITLWVRAESEPHAIAKAEQIVANRRYEPNGALSVYLEQRATESAVGSGRGLNANEIKGILGGFTGTKRGAIPPFLFGW